MGICQSFWDGFFAADFALYIIEGIKLAHPTSHALPEMNHTVHETDVMMDDKLC